MYTSGRYSAEIIEGKNRKDPRLGIRNAFTSLLVWISLVTGKCKTVYLLHSCSMKEIKMYRWNME
jgi:hypothetical protein